MRVRATLRLRNDILISARERMGLSQAQAAKKCGVPFHTYMGAEKFDIRATKRSRYRLSIETAIAHAKKIAKAMGVDESDVVSEEFFEAPPAVEFSLTAEMPARAILEAGGRFAGRNTLPASCISDADEAKAFLANTLKTRDPKVREALSLAFGLDGNREHTYNEIGKIFKCSRERVHQLVQRGLREIRERKRYEDSMDDLGIRHRL